METTATAFAKPKLEIQTSEKKRLPSLASRSLRKHAHYCDEYDCVNDAEHDDRDNTPTKERDSHPHDEDAGVSDHGHVKLILMSGGRLVMPLLRCLYSWVASLR